MMPPLTIGVISDTHGLLRPGALAALRGAAHIIHAGDIENPHTLDQLRELAPLTAVCGNCDRGEWAKALPTETIIELGGYSMAILHDLGRLSLDPQAAGLAAVISGHTHVAKCESRNGVLYFNPGSAGPRRWGKEVTLGRLTIEAGVVTGEILTLKIAV